MSDADAAGRAASTPTRTRSSAPTPTTAAWCARVPPGGRRGRRRASPDGKPASTLEQVHPGGVFEGRVEGAKLPLALPARGRLRRRRHVHDRRPVPRSCRRSASSTCTWSARAATRSSRSASARTCASSTASRGTAFAVWAPAARAVSRRRRLQLLGRPPAPDALARLVRHLGAVPARRRRRAPATSTRSSRRTARSA